MTRGRGGSAALGVLAVGAAVGVGSAAWGTLVERRRFSIRWETVPVLPPGSRDLTVLHLSDIHMAPWQSDKQQWLRDLSLVEPDFIVNTGDNVSHPMANAAVEYALEPFRGVPGVFVDGSNDHFGPSPRNPLKYFGGPSQLRKDVEPVRLDVTRQHAFFESLGWLDLNNRAHAVELRGSRLELFGTGDAHRGWDRLDLLPNTVDELRENVPWTDEPGPEPVSIGVTHAPYRRVLDAFVAQGADIVFAGHTHGGQVAVPGYGALVTNSDLPRRYASGLHRWENRTHWSWLEVSAGIGTSIYAPVRFAVRPEAVVVTLTARTV
ncbi:metallophosphoesterase [Curtobacterium sp. MCBD17_013]|uniref:metallophosphoesterase n=1 Tax=unclassified Curtobacterium TaxID=257496 RepID=UPI000DA964B9|nr:MULTISPECIES: metallophosphoesterase [unclassified Curtobacterium]PZF64377.1 metallophosphoesterase [Curtobacterium sp. MCBD17_013]WIB62637.1 metallophosphoesterase [Curtobacterium sp. MCBD17_040]WIB66474.1 metallophosphoesterase [Curtobacterium sp. MCBD17_035]